jgi:NAD(P)-dependent dehydrogenase (short-subunit alcohol dehydrogenase family)
VDLTSLQSVRDFAEEFKQKHQPLHLLINNAGIYSPPYGETKDGFESQFGVNYLSHFLLTVPTSSPVRVCVVCRACRVCVCVRVSC